MAAKEPKPTIHRSAADTTKAVDEFMSVLDHQSKDLVQAIRSSIMDADQGITEGVKWNAPSFRTTEYFATTNLREKNGVGVILHLGAKVREIPPDGLRIVDPEKLLKWLARDRATVVFKDQKDFKGKKAFFLAIIRSWITYV